MIFYFSATGNSKYVAKRMADTPRETLELLLDVSYEATKPKPRRNAAANTNKPSK